MIYYLIQIKTKRFYQNIVKIDFDYNIEMIGYKINIHI